MIIDLETNGEVDFFIHPVTLEEVKNKKYHKKGGWLFNWGDEIKANREVFAISTSNQPDEVQGLISLEVLPERGFEAVMVYLIESHSRNRYSSENRRYAGIGTALIAFSCQYSVKHDLGGYVQLTSKSSTLDFYKELNAIVNPHSRMCIFEEEIGQIHAEKFFERGL
ncbi:hypothetical protein AAAC51_07270 [Priestia megaterium]